MGVDVTIAFNYDEQYWTHVFNVELGCTILKLKEKMLEAKGGTKQDMDAFELRLRGQRVSDAEEIHQEHTLDFEFLGPDEGSKRAKEDELDQQKRAREKADALAAARRRAPTHQASSSAPAKPAAAKATIVKVVIKHAMPELQSQVTVEVASSASYLDVRRAVMAAIGESKLSEVKIVKKTGTSFQSCADGDPIGITREFLSMGRKLEVPTGDLDINVMIDAELDFKSTVKVARGSNIANLKQLLADLDPTGSTQPDTFGLGLPKASGATALVDTTILTEKHLALQVTEPYVESATSAPKVFPVVPGVAIWKVVGGSDKGGILVRKGVETKSEQLPARLSTGATVEELELQGERLHYNRITGDGPTEGWVSLTVSGKELLKRHPAEYPDAFTFERAVALQTELRDRYDGADFKGQMEELIAAIPNKKGGEYMKRRNGIIFEQQYQAIPPYGFEGSQKGVQVMMAAFGPHMGSPITQRINDEIAKLLG